MAKTLPQEQAGNQGDIFDEIGSALEELIDMVGPEDTLFALQQVLDIADERMGAGPAQTPEEMPATPTAEPEPANGLNAMMRGR